MYLHHFKPNRVFGLSVALLCSTAITAQADQGFRGFTPSYSTYGSTGLIDMPSAEMHADGTIGVGLNGFAGINRGTFTFQMLERLELVHRLSVYNNWSDADGQLLDKGFDLKYQILQEDGYIPAVSVGIQDIFANGINGAQYIAATKNLGDSLKVTAGLGWGRFSDSDTVQINDANPGSPLIDSWFSGPVGYFGGLEWQTPVNGLTAKVEYSSDTYFSENEITGTRTDVTFDRSSPFNFGLNYQTKGGVNYALQYKYGSQVGVHISTAFGPNQTRPRIDAPLRPLYRRDMPLDRSTDWLETDGIETLAITQLKTELGKHGLGFEALKLGGQRVEVWINNGRYPAPSQAFGRAARAMAKIFPDSVEDFTIVTVASGIPTAAFTVNRSNLEKFEYEPDASALLVRTVDLSDAPLDDRGMIREEGLFPKFSWSVRPTVSIELFEDDEVASAKATLNANATYNIAPDLKFTGSIAYDVYDTATGMGADPYLSSLKGEYSFKLKPDTFARVTAGYLEQDYAGVAGEVLWKPVNSKVGVGAQLAYAIERSDDWLELSSTDTVTGFVSGYYDLNNGYQAELHLGRYLAGDWGGTVELNRTFGNGFKLGAFATYTESDGDPSASFEQGLKFTIPTSWTLGRPGKGGFTRSFSGKLTNGASGAGDRLGGYGHLMDFVDEHHQTQTQASWGAFWK